MFQAISNPGCQRVAFITGGLAFGGSTTFLCNFAGELVHRGIPAQVFSFSLANPMADDFDGLKIPVHCQDERHVLWEDRLTNILQSLRRFEPSVTVATLSGESFEVLRYLPKGILRVGVAQSDDPGVYRMLANYAAHLDLLVGVSETIRRRFQDLPGFEPAQLRYLPYGVPMPAGAQEPRQFTGPLRILYVGRLEREQKRVHLFPRILSELKSSGIPFHWTVAGDGPEKAALEQDMQSAPPHQIVSFAGRIAYSEVPRLLMQNDVFLLASDFEGMPLSLLEAMGRGLVPVVSDLPSGIRELVDETTGKRVALDDVSGYAQSIVWLHEHRRQMQEFSQACRHRVQSHYSIPAMTDRWLNALPPTNSASEWPSRWLIKPPLPYNTHWYFWPPVRFLRRLRCRFKAAASGLQQSTP